MTQALPKSPDEPLLLNGDCLDKLRTLPSESVHVAVTDPPAGVNFMGSATGWDTFKDYVSRTDAGALIMARLNVVPLPKRIRAKLRARVEATIRDCLAEESEVDIADHIVQAMALSAAAEQGLLEPWEAGFVAFMVDAWTEVRRVLIPGGLVCAWALPKTADLAGLALRLAGFEMRDSLLHLFGGGMNKTGDIGKQIDKEAGANRPDLGQRIYAGGHVQRSGESIGYGGCDPAADTRRLTAPATEAAKRWTGWHSGIAPGHEQWLVAQAPGRLTYARQLPERGCGAFNVDACRVPRGDGVPLFKGRDDVSAGALGDGLNGSNRTGERGSGSHPRNVILTPGGEDCPAEGLDRQSGLCGGHGGGRHTSGGSGASWTNKARGTPIESFGDSGGASRYFTQLPIFERVGYFPKASDRRAGLSHDRNEHPTHKHVGLMRWLVRLMAAKAEHTGDKPAIVLDLFMGSGTTGVVCVAERVRFVGIEREDKHFKVARSRILGAIGSPELAAEVNKDAPVGGQLGLL